MINQKHTNSISLNSGLITNIYVHTNLKYFVFNVLFHFPTSANSFIYLTVIIDDADKPINKCAVSWLMV